MNCLFNRNFNPFDWDDKCPYCSSNNVQWLFKDDKHFCKDCGNSFFSEHGNGPYTFIVQDK